MINIEKHRIVANDYCLIGGKLCNVWDKEPTLLKDDRGILYIYEHYRDRIQAAVVVLMLMGFREPKNENHVPCFADGNKNNISPFNLFWGSDKVIKKPMSFEDKKELYDQAKVIFIATQNGRVIRRSSMNEVVYHKDNGYERFYFNGERLMKHVFILHFFSPMQKDKPLVDHIDRDKSNNNVFNLRWVDHKENRKNTTPGLKLKRVSFVKVIDTHDNDKEYIGNGYKDVAIQMNKSREFVNGICRGKFNKRYKYEVVYTCKEYKEVNTVTTTVSSI